MNIDLIFFYKIRSFKKVWLKINLEVDLFVNRESSVSILYMRPSASSGVFAVGEWPNAGSILGLTMQCFLTGVFPVIKFECSLSTRGATKVLSPTCCLWWSLQGRVFISMYNWLIVGPIVYKVCECGVRVHGVGVCLYMNGWCICIQMRGVKKNYFVYDKGTLCSHYNGISKVKYLSSSM